MRLPHAQRHLLRAVVVLLTAGFVLDLLTPLEAALWLLYLPAVALAYWTPPRAAPLLVGTASALLVTLGYLVSSSEPNTADFALLNRSLGILVLLTLGGLNLLIRRPLSTHPPSDVPLVLPANEAERLEALRQYHILDTPQEKSIDDLALLASQLCQTPIAVVSLIDSDRQWFKSRVGLQVQETARFMAFCHHTVLQTELLVIPNACKDERFSTNPLVIGPPGIRFYAGVPLLTPKGLAIGTLSVLDRAPRVLSEQQLEGLKILAGQVMVNLTLHRTRLELHTQIEEYRQAEEALRHSRERVTALIENALDAVVSVDADGRVIGWNPRAEEMFGWTADEVLGRLLVETIIPDRYRSGHLQGFQQALRQRDSQLLQRRLQLTAVRKDGAEFPVELALHAIEEEGGPTFHAFIEDTTERVAALQRLTASEIRFRSLIERSSEAILLLSLEGEVSYASPGVCHILGYDERVVLGRRLQEMVLPEDQAAVQRRLEELRPTSEAIVPIVARFRHRDGSERYLEGLLKNLLQEPTVSAIVANFRDSSERHLLEAERQKLFQEVKRSRQRLEHLSQRLLEIQEVERRQIARELHDEVGQGLTALKLNLQASERSLTQPETLGRLLSDSAGITDVLLKQVRDLSLNLRPSLLDDLGLIPALRWYTSRQADRAGLRIELLVEPMDRLPQDVEITCYRLVQEAITNVIKHAAARQVRVEVRRVEDGLELVVQDDGRGFDVEEAMHRAAEGESVGLLGMQERVRLLRGQFALTSGPNVGTRIRAVFPGTALEAAS